MNEHDTEIIEELDLDGHFAYLESIKHPNNEYHLLIGDDKAMSSHASYPIFKNELVYEERTANKEIDGEQKEIRFGVNKFKESILRRFHPNEIDNKKFWKFARERFPLFSICGAECKNRDEVNKRNFPMIGGTILGKYFDKKYHEIYEYIQNKGPLHMKSKDRVQVLEIGYGEGSFFETIIKNNPSVNSYINYQGIDYVKSEHLKEFDCFHEIDKSGIPDFIADESQDIIFASNVLQHCSRQDRYDYLRQSYQKLKSGGYFLGNMFCLTDENKGDEYWGNTDTFGNKYCHFLGQFTEVDRDDYLYDFTFIMGYKMVDSQIQGNVIYFVLKKP